MRDKNTDLLEIIKGPDFPGGAFMLYDQEELDKVFRTGRGSIKLRAKYEYVKDGNLIEITEIPATTTIEAIIEKITALVKAGKIREIQYVRDETDITGLKIAIDLKRGTDPDKLMNKLYKLTPLQDAYPCNFNVLVHGYPKVMGVYEILNEWILFRTDCVKRRTAYDIERKKERLHLLKGLGKILLDIDKAIKIIRETEEESEVVANLMVGFSIDEVQAEYVAEIKLRHLNREYILKKTAETDDLEKEIDELEDILGSDRKVRKLIKNELEDVIKKYGQERKTQFYYASDIVYVETEDETPDYQCTFFLSQSGYFKKITPQSLRMSSEQKCKEGDMISQTVEATNKTEILFFADNATVYKSRGSDFSDTKASALGDYVPAKLSFDEGANVFKMVTTTDYSGYVIFVFENGKCAKVPLSAYATKTNRKKLANAYSSKAKLVDLFFVAENEQLMLRSSNGRMIIFDTALLLPKAARDTQGVQAMTLKAKSTLEKAFMITDEQAQELAKYKAKNIPAAGSFAKDVEDPDQLHF